MQSHFYNPRSYADQHCSTVVTAPSGRGNTMSEIPAVRKRENSLLFFQAHSPTISLQWSTSSLTGTMIFWQAIFLKMVSFARFFLTCQKAGDHWSQVEKWGSLQCLVKHLWNRGKAEGVLAIFTQLFDQHFYLILLKFSYESLRNIGSIFPIFGVGHLKVLLHENWRHLGHLLDLISFIWQAWR